MTDKKVASAFHYMALRVNNGCVLWTFSGSGISLLSNEDREWSLLCYTSSFLCKKGLSNREVADIFFVFLLSYQMYLIHFFPSLRASTVCHLMSVVMRELAKSILQLSIFTLFSIFSLNRWRGEEVKGNLLLFDLLFLFFWWQNSLRLKTDSKLITAFYSFIKEMLLTLRALVEIKRINWFPDFLYTFLQWLGTAGYSILMSEEFLMLLSLLFFFFFFYYCESIVYLI